MRELLCHSIDGRNLELLTFASFRHLSYERENLLEKLFPKTYSKADRPLQSKKPTIFISARVHPGEVPSSHVMNGILNLLSKEDDYQTLCLLDNFTFKIVPMINPDGVYRGHYRLDNLG